MSDSDLNLAVARYWHATYSDSLGSETSLLEIRHTPRHGFLLHTQIRGVEYHIFEQQFMGVFQEFLSRLSPEAALSITHEIVMHRGGKEKLVQLIEHISSRGAGESISIAYQYFLFLDGVEYVTEPFVDAAMAALDSLVAQLGRDTYFKTCAFCDLLFEDDAYGGTDDRHDLTYCFRDRRDALEKLKTSPRKSPSFPHSLLGVALQDVDMLHACSSFALSSGFDSRIKRTRQ